MYLCRQKCCFSNYSSIFVAALFHNAVHSRQHNFVKRCGVNKTNQPNHPEQKRPLLVNSRSTQPHIHIRIYVTLTLSMSCCTSLHTRHIPINMNKNQ